MTTSAGTTESLCHEEDARVATRTPWGSPALRPVARGDLTDHDGCASSSRSPSPAWVRARGWPTPSARSCCSSSCSASTSSPSGRPSPAPCTPTPPRASAPVPASSPAGRSSGPTTSSQWPGLCGFAVFCGQLLSALGYHGSVHPIIFFAISAVACWVIAYKDIRGLVDPHDVARGGLGRLHHRPGLRHPVQARLLGGHQAAVAQRRERPRHGPRRGRLHLLPRRLRGATTMGAEAKNPRRNLPRAVIASLLITGAFMVFMAYVEVVGTSNYGAAWTSAPLIYAGRGLRRQPSSRSRSPSARWSASSRSRSRASMSARASCSPWPGTASSPGTSAGRTPPTARRTWR